MRVLLVEDDAALVAAMSKGLRDAGFAVDCSRSAEEALDRLALNPYDVMILDIGLPGADGITLLSVLRERQLTLPVLVLTARGAVGDRVTGLDAGADDYMPKPFAFPELLARLRALLRRGTQVTSSVLRVADLEIDPARHHAQRGDRPLKLTTKEFAILEYLMRHAGTLVTRTMLLEGCWDDSYDGLSNMVDVHVSRVRRKLDVAGARPLLHTIRGAGFLLGERET